MAERIVDVAANKNYENIRGRDRKKLDIEWANPEVLLEYPDDPKGLKMCRIADPVDIETLGRLEGHCAGTHFVWVCEEQIWHFLTLIDKDNVPHTTIHAKSVEWRNKQHPRDKLAFPFVVERLKSSGHYQTWRDVVATAEKQNIELPEPGTYGPLGYPSSTYGSGPVEAYPNSVLIGEHEVSICSVSGKGLGDYDYSTGERRPGKYTDYINQWYEQFKTENKLECLRRY